MSTEQQLAQSAIESSFKSDVGRLFANLITALASAETSAAVVDQATAAFRRGYAQSKLAFEKASAVIGEGAN
jgi:hypothetical protein